MIFMGHRRSFDGSNDRQSLGEQKHESLGSDRSSQDEQRRRQQDNNTQEQPSKIDLQLQRLGIKKEKSRENLQSNQPEHPEVEQRNFFLNPEALKITADPKKDLSDLPDIIPIGTELQG